jgi:hypothetical protein
MVTVSATDDGQSWSQSLPVTVHDGHDHHSTEPLFLKTATQVQAKGVFNNLIFTESEECVQEA